jgi:putative DNA primase/helicase
MEASPTIQFLRLLCSPGSVHELRVLAPTGRVSSGYYDDLARLAADAVAQSGIGNVYVTLNPVSPDCRSRACNRSVWAGRGGSTKDGEITRRTTLLIDFDPIRVTGIPSTDEEHAAALDLAKTVRHHLSEIGWPEPLMTDSGNGAALLYRIDLPTDDGGLVKRVLEHASKRFSTGAVKIDTSVHNAARITRVPGTLNFKGENRPERPHRLAKIVEQPMELKYVRREQLEQFVGTDHAVAESGKRACTASHFDAPAWLTSKGIGFTEKRGECHGQLGTWYTLAYCPFKGPDHTDGNTGIFVAEDGRVFAKCHHDKCKAENWRSLRRKIDPTFDVTADRRALGGSRESVKDPHRLARAVLEHFDHPEHRTLILHGSAVYRWDTVWKAMDDDEVKRLIWRVAKEEFDDFSKKLLQWGKDEQVPSVGTRLVNDVFNALRSMVEVKANVGDWLAGEGPPPCDLMICKNGVLDLAGYLEGKPDVLVPHTPRLFVLNRLDFDFDPAAPAPERWLQFLEEVWPDDLDSRQLLQQFFGYALTNDVSHQKFLMLLGATRGGKGVITRLLNDLVGRENCCSIRLTRLADEYSLANAVGKSLILMPDATMPRHDREDATVETLKAITGGDVIDVNRKYLPVLSTALTAKVVITSNRRIEFPDNSRALHERMLVLPFGISFASHPDKDLGAKLKAELPGILLWAIEGWRSLRESGRFAEPKTGEELKGDILESSSPIQAFIAECCVIDSRARADKDELFQLWEQWSRARCDERITKAEFGKKLFEAQPQVRNFRPRIEGKRLWLYTGIGLKERDSEQVPPNEPANDSSASTTGTPV